MGKIIVAIANFLFPIMKMEVADAPSAESTEKKPFLPMNEHAYFVNRLERRIRDAHREEDRRKEAVRYAKYGHDHDFDYDRFDSSYTDYAKLLNNLRLSTLRMLDKYPRLHEVDQHVLAPSKGESDLRNHLLLSTHPGNEDIRLSTMRQAVDAMQTHHDMPNDLTKASSRVVYAVGAACGFLSATSLFKQAPPRLTDFVMRNPDRVSDITEFMKLHCTGEDAVHNIDISHVRDYLDCPAPSLREGML